LRAEPAGNDLLRNDSRNIARTDHAKRNPRHDVDEIERAFPQRGGHHLFPAPEGEEAHRDDGPPEQDINQQRRAHPGSSFFGYMRT
jgi:hypothetical protein